MRELTDDERQTADWYWQDWAILGPPRPEVWHEDSHLAFLAGYAAALETKD